MKPKEFLRKMKSRSGRTTEDNPFLIQHKSSSHALQDEVYKLRYKHRLELHELKHRHHEEFHDLHHVNHLHHEEFRRMHHTLRFFRPVGLVFSLILLYLLFYWDGFKAIVVVVALLLTVKEILQFFFFRKLERRVFKPVEQLKEGLAEIAKGNYNVAIDCAVENEFGQLIHSFNEMAAKLQESNQINLEYEENRKTLVANISHDLKTPITSIQGYLEMILEGDVSDPDKINRYLKTIHSNTAYINRLIDDLFLFSKLDMDKMDFKYEILNIRAFMRDLSDEFRFLLQERQDSLSFEDKTQEEYSVSIDGKRVYQAIRNIMDNAIKYGPDKNLEVTIGLYVQADHVCIDIKDNGPGIPEDQLPHIFNRFYRIDTERSKDFMSTGLGLAIAKELIEAQGGKIEVSSSRGTGTCFTIRLPIVA